MCIRDRSWDQRLRWSKGFYQVDFKYGLSLLKGCFTNKTNKFSCYDMLMTVAPGMLLTLVMLAMNLMLLVTCFTEPAYIACRIFHEASGAVISAIVMFYISLFTFGAATTITEWKKIVAKMCIRDRASMAKKRFCMRFSSGGEIIPAKYATLLIQGEPFPAGNGCDRRRPGSRRGGGYSPIQWLQRQI